VADRLVQVILLVTDLGAARSEMAALGLAVLDGGRHPGRGTANLIVPFGHQYLELLALVDGSEASSSPQGRPVVAALTSRGPGLARWSVEPDDIESTARRVGEPIERRQRLVPDGTTVRWRSVGVDRSWPEPWRCAFMSWDEPHLHPARGRVSHPNGATGFARLEVGVPATSTMASWLGGPPPPGVELEVGEPLGIRRLTLSSPTGEIAIG
jgi:hypothetical protein